MANATLLLLTLIGFVMHLLFHDMATNHQSQHQLVKRSATSTNISLDEEIFDTCNLTIYDPFHKEIGLWTSWTDPKIGCNTSYEPMTILKNGILTVNRERQREFSYCRAKCYPYKKARQTKREQWFNVTGQVVIDSDFVKAECYSKDGQLVDKRLHLQIVESNTSTVEVEEPKSEMKRPDVFIFVLDSVSSTQARRSLPRTLSFLETRMGGRNFHHLNKVGDNTRPNAYAMLLGWRIYDVVRNAVNAPNLKADHPRVCGQHRDNDSVIFKEFEKIGYKTLYSDDFPAGTAFSWNCKGFKEQEANHLFRPFVVKYHQDRMLSRRFQTVKNCFEMHQAQLGQFEHFLDAYKGKPKFGLYWSTRASHDSVNDLYHTDDDYQDFFANNQHKLQNAFIFLMGDHGQRFGSQARTELGNREINNPLLHIVVPKFLRDNEQLEKNLAENSVRLLTQYDIHATLVDILQQASQGDFADFSQNVTKTTEVDEGNNATSLLRPFPERFQQRNCRNIPVNTIYCLCEYPKQRIKDDEEINEAGKAAIADLNSLIAAEGAAKFCAKLSIDKVKSLIGYSPIEKTKLYEIVFKTTPSKGLFSVLLKRGDDGILRREGEFQRLNKYGQQADCVAADPRFHNIRPLCFCRNQKSRRSNSTKLFE